MPGKENSQERRQWILDAALEVFYECGFDGARVDEIAKRAGVNQALIYYYFKSKEELYLELINQNVDEMIQEKKNSVGAANTEELYNIDIYNADVIKRLVDHVMRIAKEKEKIFSIILGELFRNSRRKNNSSETFRILLHSIDVSRQGMRGLGIDETEIERQLIKAIFFASLPVFTYTTLGDRLAEDYGLKKEMMREVFTQQIYHFSEEYVEFIKEYNQGAKSAGEQGLSSSGG